MNARARRIAVTIAALAAVVTPAAFSKPAAGPSANMVLQVEFGVGYEVTATLREGDPAAECTGWKDTKVTYEVNAKSGPRPPSRVYAIRGLFTNFAVLPAKVRNKIRNSLGWYGYEFTAVGVAHGTVFRRLDVTGEDKTCASGSAVVTPVRPPSNDCGTRSFTTRTASLKAGFRQPDGNLTGLMKETLGLPGHSKYAIAFSVAPERELYRACEAATSAPTYPIGAALVLPPGFVAPGLTRMKVGDIRRYAHQYDGDCDDTLTPLGGRADTCTFSLDLNVRIKRTA